jgi:hypothetical protein
MTSVTTTRTSRTAPAVAAEPPRSGRTLGSVVSAASDAVAGVPLDDRRWDRLGPALTGFVHAARLAAGLAGSPIRPDEPVSAVLRLRDLARLAQCTARSSAFATADAEAGLRWLQAVAAVR